MSNVFNLFNCYDHVHNSSNKCLCKCSCVDLSLYIRKYPYYSTVYRIKYNTYDWIISIVLFILLLSVALIFGNIGSLLNYRSLHPSDNICIDKDNKIEHLQALILNITRYNEVIYNVTIARNITRDMYIRSNSTYYGWPNPYKMTDKQIDDLTRRTKLQCSKRVCLGVSFNIGFNCKRVTFPCPDIDASNKLDEYKMWNDMYSIDINNLTVTCTNNITNITINNTMDISNVTDDICNSTYSSNSTYLGDTLIKLLDEMLNRISLANSIYVVYSAFTIFFGSAVIITKVPISNTVSTSVIKKYWWIIFVLFIWYLVDLLLMLTQNYAFSGLSNAELDNISIYISAIWYEPCWLDSGYSSDIYSYIRKTCSELGTWENRFSAASNEYDHDRLVAESYVVDGLPQIYPNNTFMLDNICNEQLLITTMYTESINDSETIGFVDVIRRLGHVLILFLQPIIAHWIRSVFSLCKPLSAQSGKVIVPIDYLVNVMYKDDIIRTDFDENIKSFYRSRSFRSLVFYTLLLTLSVCYIIIN